MIRVRSEVVMPSHIVTFVDDQGHREVARRRKNPDGSTGGWVSKSAKVHPTAIIEVDAIVEPGQVVAAGEYVRSVRAIPIDVDEYNITLKMAT